MKIRALTFTVLLVIIFAKPQLILSQVSLDGFIGEESLPSDMDAICEFPIYPDILPFVNLLYPGDVIPDFKLFDLNGDSIVASQILSDGKPLLLIGCSYTCNIFRSKIPDIQTLQDVYGDDINIFLIYTIEAHPNGDPAPYLGEDVTYPGVVNETEGVLYLQPTTYGQRKSIVEDMMAAYDVPVPVYIDGPCNNWLLNFGFYPNASFLISPDGSLYNFQEWFNKLPDDDIFEVMEQYFTGEGHAGTEAAGYFEISGFSEECINGDAGNTITAAATINNTDTLDTYLDIIKIESSLPEGWETSLCTDVCYPPAIDTGNYYIESGEAADLHIYFYTTPDLEAEGSLTVLVRNHYNHSNWDIMEFKACTDAGTSIIEQQVYPLSQLMIMPNPAADFIQFILPDAAVQHADVILRNISGQQILHNAVSNNNQSIFTIQLPALNPGIYLIEVKDLTGNAMYTGKVCIQ